jgi:hypothetical protein
MGGLVGVGFYEKVREKSSDLQSPLVLIIL